MRGLVVALVLVLIAAPALGQPPASGLPPPPTERIVMRLDFTGVGGCSDPEPFILALTPLVHGWDPLAPDGRWRLVVTIEKQAREYKGTDDLHDPKGDAVWAKPISIPPKASCFILLDRLAYKTAYRIDPPGAPPPPAPAPPSPPPKPEKPPAPVAPPEPEPVKPEPNKVELPAEPVQPRFEPRVGAGALLDFGAAWGVLAEVTIEGGFHRRAWGWGGWSLMGELRWTRSTLRGVYTLHPLPRPPVRARARSTRARARSTRARARSTRAWWSSASTTDAPAAQRRA